MMRPNRVTSLTMTSLACLLSTLVQGVKVSKLVGVQANVQGPDGMPANFEEAVKWDCTRLKKRLDTEKCKCEDPKNDDFCTAPPFGERKGDISDSHMLAPTDCTHSMCDRERRINPNVKKDDKCCNYMEYDVFNVFVDASQGVGDLNVKDVFVKGSASSGKLIISAARGLSEGEITKADMGGESHYKVDVDTANALYNKRKACPENPNRLYETCQPQEMGKDYFEAYAMMVIKMMKFPQKDQTNNLLWIVQDSKDMEEVEGSFQEFCAPLVHAVKTWKGKNTIQYCDKYKCFNLGNLLTDCSLFSYDDEGPRPPNNIESVPSQCCESEKITSFKDPKVKGSIKTGLLADWTELQTNAR